MERTIRVTGKGKISVKPDTIRLIITQTGTEKEYEDAIRESATQKEYLSGAIEQLGLKKENLKTLTFHIDTEYEGYEAADKSWKRRLVGYRFTHRIKLEFPADNTFLGKVLFAVSRCPGQPEFEIQHTVANPEAAKNALLAIAVEDSKTKAEVLSKAAGVGLGPIVTIDYSWGEIDFVTRPMDQMVLQDFCAKTGSTDEISLVIEADDIDVTDTVTVVWEIR